MGQRRARFILFIGALVDPQKSRQLLLRQVRTDAGLSCPGDEPAPVLRDRLIGWCPHGHDLNRIF